MNGSGLRIPGPGPEDPDVRKAVDEIATRLKASGSMGSSVSDMTPVTITFGTFVNLVWAATEVLDLRKRLAALEKRFE